MKSILTIAAAFAALAAAPALAQNAPDGSKATGIEPYAAVMGTYDRYDSEPNRAGIPVTNRELRGGVVDGIVGVNLPVGPVFVGVEGTVGKGFSGDIDWTYGAAGRFGFRAGDSGLIYGKVGYRWVNFDRFGPNSRDYHDVVYGGGFEVGPKMLNGLRLRGEVETFGSTHSIRPSLGVVAHF